ncbi:Transcription factor bHLH84 [Morella rubra]|uniref:Transcription factor bHLH84 n=1 Tax=Morella rubra TaxID=262757 RepID=A0A6A1WSG7_9ROSI|nr:Transcription factor bHLH84 [Morella rubra]KAB1228275.1 Transcription factor bHLH84 [Morella rubra]
MEVLAEAASPWTAADDSEIKAFMEKRRERINGGAQNPTEPCPTKIDISTMLEEAAQYVKFLQLQIKLLSSDELWMFAPIPYDGMNTGLDLKINPPS